MRPWVCDVCKKQVESYGVYIREGWHEHKYIGGKADLCSFICLRVYIDQMEFPIGYLVPTNDPLKKEPSEREIYCGKCGKSLGKWCGGELGTNLCAQCIKEKP